VQVVCTEQSSTSSAGVAGRYVRGTVGGAEACDDRRAEAMSSQQAEAAARNGAGGSRAQPPTNSPDDLF
jgi:hypothetical protein